MRIVRGHSIETVPASHEDPLKPGSLKKVLMRRDDLNAGRVQMINWAILPAGRRFRRHFHQDMDEVFIITSGDTKIRVGDEDCELRTGDLVFIPAGAAHEMWNDGPVDVHYIALGISSERGGKTIVVE